MDIFVKIHFMKLYNNKNCCHQLLTKIKKLKIRVCKQNNYIPSIRANSDNGFISNAFNDTNFKF